MKQKTVLYKGRHIPEQSFRVHVYDKAGNKKQVDNYTDFSIALASGDWFIDKPNVSRETLPKRRKKGGDKCKQRVSS